MAGIKTGLAIVLMYFSTQASPKTITGNLVAVHQGDTFTIKSIPPDEKLYKVRLSNIDTPELKQPFGLRAKEFTKNQIFGKEIQIEYEMVDFYGRLVGSVILPQGKILNEELVRAGLAWHYRVIRLALHWNACNMKHGEKNWVFGSILPPFLLGNFGGEKNFPFPRSRKIKWIMILF